MKAIEIHADSIVNRTTVEDGDPRIIAEFRRRVAQQGLKVDDRLVVDFQSKPGIIRVHSYPPRIWVKTMKTFRFNEVMDKENQALRGLKKAHQQRGGMRIRESKRPEGRFFDARWK